MARLHELNSALEGAKTRAPSTRMISAELPPLSETGRT